MREQVQQAGCWVVKIGSSLITNDGSGLDHRAIAGWVGQLAKLHAAGRQIVLVSSGAVAEGVSRLGLPGRPRSIHLQQAAAAVGQMGLVQAWESAFQRYSIHTAQLLLAHDDLSSRRRYLNARSTLDGLLRMHVIPVVNENDTVATAELRFGDNDTLAALVANLINADGLIILTDQQGVHESDPRGNPDAPVIAEARAGERWLDEIAGDSGSLGSGGMRTKIHAARTAARSGAFTLIASGREEGVLQRLTRGEVLGTLLLPDQAPVTARKQWLAGQLRARGQLLLDAGAVKVLRESGRSLLPVGVTAVRGQFDRGELVQCLDEGGREVARGLVNYDSREARALTRQPSNRIESLLGYAGDEEMIHRDNMVVTEHS